MFPCDMCGECCRHLKDMLFYDDLHDGNGICRYLDGNRCTIYENRPLKCNIDKAYDSWFKDKMSKEEFYRLNQTYCQVLKEKAQKEKSCKE